MKRSSIALRLALGLSVGTAMLWIGAATISGIVMRHELGEAFDEILRQSAFRLLPLAIHALRDPGAHRSHEVEGLAEGEEYVTYFVRDRAGNLVVQALDAPKELSGVKIPDGFSTIDGRRIFATTDPRMGYRITVIELNNHRAKAFEESVAVLAWPLAGLIPLIGLGIWFAIRLAMRPVERLRRDIESRGSRNLSPLSSEDHPKELAPIAEAVASLLARLRSAMETERAFAASSAHELRTPIAGALAQTQQLAIELGGKPGHERLKDIEAALRHLAQLSEKLLQLSRLEAGFAQSDVQTDLLPVLPLVIRDFQSRSKGGVNLHVAKDATLSAAINMDAFAIAIANVVQNGLIHGRTGSPVDVHVEAGNIVRVVSAGPIVPAETLGQIARPFVRGATSADGTGLGLSIVRSIMEQTGGVLTFHSPASGQAEGFEAVLSWPEDAPMSGSDVRFD